MKICTKIIKIYYSKSLVKKKQNFYLLRSKSCKHEKKKHKNFNIKYFSSKNVKKNLFSDMHRQMFPTIKLGLRRKNFKIQV